jgi:hypothetical protein
MKSAALYRQTSSRNVGFQILTPVTLGCTLTNGTCIALQSLCTYSKLYSVPVQSRKVQMCTLLQVPIRLYCDKVQFCTVFQVPTRLYGDGRNLYSFTASAPAVSYKMFLYNNEDFHEILRQLPRFPNAHILNVAAYIELCLDTYNYFKLIFRPQLE